ASHGRSTMAVTHSTSHTASSGGLVTTRMDAMIRQTARIDIMTRYRTCRLRSCASWLGCASVITTARRSRLVLMPSSLPLRANRRSARPVVGGRPPDPLDGRLVRGVGTLGRRAGPPAVDEGVADLGQQLDLLARRLRLGLLATGHPLVQL